MVLPAYLACARLVSSHDATRISPAITNAIPLCDAILEGPWLFVFGGVQTALSPLPATRCTLNGITQRSHGTSTVDKESGKAF